MVAIISPGGSWKSKCLPSQRVWQYIIREKHCMLPTSCPIPRQSHMVQLETGTSGCQEMACLCLFPHLTLPVPSSKLIPQDTTKAPRLENHPWASVCEEEDLRTILLVVSGGRKFSKGLEIRENPALERGSWRTKMNQKITWLKVLQCLTWACYA